MEITVCKLNSFMLLIYPVYHLGNSTVVFHRDSNLQMYHPADIYWLVRMRIEEVIF
jgi:hypothetical protein